MITTLHDVSFRISEDDLRQLCLLDEHYDIDLTDRDGCTVIPEWQLVLTLRRDDSGRAQTAVLERRGSRFYEPGAPKAYADRAYWWYAGLFLRPGGAAEEYLLRLKAESDRYDAAVLTAQRLLDVA